MPLTVRTGMSVNTALLDSLYFAKHWGLSLNLSDLAGDLWITLMY